MLDELQPNHSGSATKCHRHCLVTGCRSPHISQVTLPMRVGPPHRSERMAWGSMVFRLGPKTATKIIEGMPVVVGACLERHRNVRAVAIQPEVLEE